MPLSGLTLSVVCATAGLMVMAVGAVVWWWRQHHGDAVSDKSGPLTSKEHARLSGGGRSPSRHPLPAGGPDQEYDGSTPPPSPNHLLLRTALSRSMEHLVFEPTDRPSYAPKEKLLHNTISSDFISQSELSSFTSDDESHDGERTRFPPRVDLTLLYSTSDLTLTSRVQRLSHVPARYRQRPLLLRCWLLGARRQLRVRTTVASTDAEEEAHVQAVFSNVASSWLQQGRLSCQLFARASSWRAERQLGEGSLRLAQLGLAKGRVVPCRLVMNRCLKRACIPLQMQTDEVPEPLEDDSTTADADGRRVVAGRGTIEGGPVDSTRVQMALRYDVRGQQLNLVVAALDNLPRTSILMRPQYFVRVSLLRSGEVVKTGESSRAGGGAVHNWNQQFSFTVTQAQLPAHWLLCEVCLVRRYSRERLLGLCQLGQDTGEEAVRQWEAATRTQVIPVWHLLVIPEGRN